MNVSKAYREASGNRAVTHAGTSRTSTIDLVTAREDALTPEELAIISETRRALKNGRARRRREAKCIRLGEFAAAGGWAESTVSQWERGIREPGAQDALAYARQLAALERKAA